MIPCLWKSCGGWMKQIIDKDLRTTWVCAKCGRSPNVNHEKYVAKESLKPHRDMHIYSTSAFERRIKKNLKKERRKNYERDALLLSRINIFRSY